MDSILQDFRYAARRLFLAPGFTITAALTLAIGIGAVTSVFSLVDGVLLRSLPFPASDRLMNVFAGGTSPLGLYEVASESKGTVEAAAAMNQMPRILGGMGPATWVQSPSVTAGFFPLLGARAYLGRLLAPDEDRPGSPPVTVLSHAFWIRQFGGDPGVLGRTIRLDSTEYRVVGVTFPAFQYPAHADMWCNLGPWISGPGGAQRSAGNVWWTLVRLRSGVTPIRAESELRAAFRTQGSAYPTVRGDLISVEPLQGFLVGEVQTGLWILLCAVGLLLLTAATNVASLLVSRIVDRDRELAVRTALGARRARLVSLVLTESVLVAALGGVGGLFLASASLQSLLFFVGRDMPQIVDIHLSWPVLAFAGAVTLGTGLLAGLVPAIQAGRCDPIEGIKGYGRHGVVRQRPGNALVVVQVALTVVLLSGAGLLGRSFWKLIRLDPGYRSSDVVASFVMLPGLRYPTGRSRALYAARALERLGTLPGVTAAAVSTSVPGASGEISFNVTNPEHPDLHAITPITEATPAFLDVLGVPLRRGRWATDPGTMAISEAGARIYFPGEDPLGRVLTVDGQPGVTVVGVVGDTRQDGLNQDPPPQLYGSLGPNASMYLHLVVRTSEAPSTMVPQVRKALQDLDLDTPVNDVAPLSAEMRRSLATERSYAVALGVFALAALGLAAIGIYGLVATGVARRTREIGIRIALGAERQNVMGSVLGRGAALAGLGLVIGLGGSMLGTRVLKRMLFQVNAGDPVVFGVVALVLFVATLAATYVPARRAAAVDPMEALRTD
ncbi:MAG TPA: ABC transporter permease [Gemmatimonadales bacterium]|nr:ABC transporter permease [Gemmatimonadales bacterium]